MMKKTVSPNRKMGRMIAKNLIILLVLILVAFVSMWAWFTTGARAEADGINVQCKASAGIDLAVVPHGAAAPDSSKYTKTLNLSDVEGLLDDLTLTEVTSDGVTFYRPSLQQNSGIATPVIRKDGQLVTWDKANEQVHYLSFDLYIRSQSKQTVYLDRSSSFIPNSINLVGASAGNISSYGNFSRDCIVGAARFSIVDTSNKRQLLWVPHPELKLVEDTVADEASGSSRHVFSMMNNLASGSTYEHQYYAVNSDGTPHETPTILGTDVVVGSTKNVGSNNYTLSERTKVLQLTGTPQNGYYYNHVTCNMWVEGEDEEARLALVGGKFKVDLDFSAEIN